MKLGFKHFRKFVAAAVLVGLVSTGAIAQDAEEEVFTLPQEISLALAAANAGGDPEELAALLSQAIVANPESAGLLIKAVVAVQPETGLSSLSSVISQVANSSIANKSALIQQVVSGAAEGGIAAQSGAVEVSDSSNAVKIQTSPQGDAADVESTAEFVKELMAVTVAAATEAFDGNATELKNITATVVGSVMQVSQSSALDSQALVQAASEGAVSGAITAAGDDQSLVQSLVSASAEAVSESIVEAASGNTEILENVDSLLESVTDGVVNEVQREFGTSSDVGDAIFTAVDENLAENTEAAESISFETAGEEETVTQEASSESVSPS